MDIRAEIRRELEAAHAIAKAAADANRGLTDDETQKIEAHKAKVADLKKALAAQELAATLDAEAAEYEGAPSHQGGAPTRAATHADDPESEPKTARVQVKNRDEEKGDALGALVSARVRFGQNQDAAKAWARKQYGERSPQMLAMQQSVFTAGGATIAENFVGQELIELLRAKAAVRRAGARMLPLVNGSATLPKITGGSSSYWGAEGDNIQASDMTTGQVKLVEKKLTSLVPVSNDLLKNSNLAVDRMIRDDMVASSANAEDIAFLKGDGLVNAPKGIYYWVGSAGRTNSAGDTLANIRTDVKVSRNRLGNNNAPNIRRAWFMHSRDLTYIGTEVVDANSNLVWPAMADGDGARWNSGTVYEDNNIAIDLGGGGDESEVYYAEMSECFIGDSGELELEVFLNGTYVDSGGNLRSGISRDESVVRLIRKTDFAMRHAESAHVLEAVSYGA
jgi:HK97 family phage major capsid protein